MACACTTSTRGEGDPVLLLHGEPTWAYLYRKIIPNAELDPPLQAAGHFLQEDQGEAIGRRIAAFRL